MPTTPEGVACKRATARKFSDDAASARHRRLQRLQTLLARDEWTRPRPPITLPRAARAELRLLPRARHPRQPALPEVAAIVAAVESHFGVPVTELVRKRERANAPRHPAEEIVIYLVRSLGRQTLVACAAELGISDAKAWNAYSKIRHRRAVDPDLDRTITAIEAQLGAAR